MNVKLVSGETSVEIRSIPSPKLSLLLKYKQVILFFKLQTKQQQKTSFTVSEAVGHFTALDLYFWGGYFGFLNIKNQLEAVIVNIGYV